MGLPIAPILIGAGVGALGGALTGNNPFKTALLGGALGTGAGALGLGGAGATATGAGTAGTTAAELLPTSLAVAPESAAAASPLFGYGTEAGLGAVTDAAIPTAADIGAGFGTDTIANMAANNPSMFEQLKPYLSANNVMGAANMALNYKPTQRSPAPQGHVSQGQIPQGGLGAGGVEGLLAEITKQRKTQHQPISLLVG